MPSRLRPLVGPILFVIVVVGLYALLRSQRDGLVDFVVPRTAAARFLAHEPLYRPEDGHYQYKYFPAFAGLMVPFTWLPSEAAQFTWFTLTVAMTWALVQLSVRALPDRRRSAQALVWLTLFVNGKFLVKELAFGQFNLPVALLMLGAVMAARHGRGLAAGAAVAAGVFVKPYALILVPWLAWTLGWRPFVVFGAVLAAGLLLPVASYGWSGNVTLLHEWYRTVTDTTAPSLLMPETISFASMWAKWLQPGRVAASLALASSVIAVAAGFAVMWRRDCVAEPNYLEGAYFAVLVPLLSPQGWDYVLVIAMPAYMVILDRLRDLSPAWRVVALTGIVLTSFSIYDVMRRTLYLQVMELAGVSVGAVLIAACLINLRWRRLA